MSLIERYGIKVGQIYHAADGSDLTLKVTDTTSFADCDDVVVSETVGTVTMLNTRRIDAFKLFHVRFFLCDECN